MPEQIFKSTKNKWLVVIPGVILTASIDAVIFNLDSFLKDQDKVRYVTSGLRDGINQLRVIIEYCQSYDIPVNFVKEDLSVKILNTDNYIWQDAWSKLRQAGLIINPPFACACLYDHEKNGEFIKAGIIIPASPHSKGTCFDISAWRGNQTESETKNVDDEVEIIKSAMEQDSNLGIISYVIERANNCLHINTKLIEAII
jgi:hypothetical protein